MWRNVVLSAYKSIFRLVYPMLKKPTRELLSKQTQTVMSAEKPEELHRGSILGSPEIEEQILSKTPSNENISAVPSKIYLTRLTRL